MRGLGLINIRDLFGVASTRTSKRIELVVRLVRSKGVGVYFVTQNPLDLPQTGAASLNVDKQPLIVSLKADGKLYLMDTETSITELVPKLQAIAKTGPEERIFVRGDKAIAYGKVAEVMAALSSAGYKKVALVNAPDGK